MQSRTFAAQWSRYALIATVAATIGIAVGLRGVPVAHSAQAGGELASLQAQIRSLQDENEIRALLIEYGRRLDAHDLAGYSELFAKDGEWIGGFGRAAGPAGILALMQKSMGATPADPKNITGFHVLTNPLVHVDGERATALSKWMFFTPTPDNRPAPRFGGHYDDTLVRENGHWKFQRRIVFADIPFQDPRNESAVNAAKP